MAVEPPKRLNVDQHARWLGMGYRWKVLFDGVDITAACREADRVWGWAECYTESFAHVRLEGHVKFEVCSRNTYPIGAEQARSHVSALVERSMPLPTDPPEEPKRRAIQLEGEL